MKQTFAVSDFHPRRKSETVLKKKICCRHINVGIRISKLTPGIADIILEVDSLT